MPIPDASLNGKILFNAELQFKGNQTYGTIPNFLSNYAQKFKLGELKTNRTGIHGTLSETTGDWTHSYGKLQGEEIDMITIGKMGALHYKHFDFGNVYSKHDAAFCSRRDFPSLTLLNVVKAFSPGIWLGFYATLIVFAVAFLTAYKVDVKQGRRRVKPVLYDADFFIRTIASITEPEGIPWFKYQSPVSPGRILNLCWATFATFLIFFYNSNLRAHLIKSDTEPNLESVDDILYVGGKFYIHTIAVIMQPKNIGQLDQLFSEKDAAEMKALVTKVKEHDTNYDFVEFRGLMPKYVVNDIYSDNRASILCSLHTWEFAFQEDPDKLNTKAFYKSDHVLYTAYTGDVMRKYSTYSYDIYRQGMLLHE